MDRAVIDDLPEVRIPRLRAVGLVSPEMDEFVVRLGDVAQSVGLKTRRFPNSGSWSFFVAPCCGRLARVLRLFYGRVMCWCCLRDCGARYRCWPMSVRRRAERRVPQLCAMLEEESLCIKPSTLWGTMARHSRHETAFSAGLFLSLRYATAGISGCCGRRRMWRWGCIARPEVKPRRSRLNHRLVERGASRSQKAACISASQRRGFGLGVGQVFRRLRQGGERVGR